MSKISSPSLSVVKQKIGKIRPYVDTLVFLLFTLTYGFVVLRINSLSDPKISQNSINAAITKSPTPRIDEKAATQLLSLKDNSVNVRTLFEESRTNPFQE